MVSSTQAKEKLHGVSRLTDEQVGNLMELAAMDGPVTTELRVFIRKSYDPVKSRYKMAVLKDPLTQAYMIGGYMENVTGAIRTATIEAEEAKKALQKTLNSTQETYDGLKPKLVAQIQAIRNMRLTTVTEMNAMLSAMKDVRKFFLESDYREEMDRLKEFVAVCKELETLKESGLLDAVSDTILKLTEGTRKE